MYIMNFEIPAFTLSLLCFIYCITAKRRQYVLPKTFKAKLTNQHTTFLLVLLTNMLSSVSSVVGVYLTKCSFDGVEIWQYLFHAFYFIFHSTLSISFTLYIMNVIGVNSNWKKRHYIIFLIPYVISEVLILTNSFTNWAFYIDENYVYHRGKLMILLYSCGIIYVLLGFVFFIKKAKAISKVDNIAVALFIVIATLGIVGQAIWSQYLVELFAESLACLVIMIVLEEKSGHIDLTTGLLNRIAFIDTNRKLLSSKQEYNIIFINIHELDKFLKRFGGREADAFLINVSSFLTKEAGVLDLYTYKRESFAIIYKDKTYDETLIIANKIIERFNQEWNVFSLQIKVDAVATILNVPNDLNNLVDIENILSSNFEKKKSGSYFILKDEILEINKQGLYEAALKKAIKENKLLLYYQPIWSVKDKKTVSAEALLRVDLDELKYISPEIYIPIAEKTGLIKDIGLFVFEEVCKFLNDERIKNSNIKYVELNLSVYQFMFNDLFEEFEKIRAKYNISSNLINLEITETTASLDENVVSDTLKKLLNVGYSLSLDDFGTGYSNFVRMIGSHYKIVKIDKSILWSEIKKETETLKNLMTFVKNLGYQIVQEGVEDDEQLKYSIDAGCDFIQGYYFSKPVSKEEFINYLINEK